MKLKLNKKNSAKVFRGAGIAGLGAALAYLLEAVPGIELGEATPVVVALLSVAVNYVRKLQK